MECMFHWIIHEPSNNSCNPACMQNAPASTFPLSDPEITCEELANVSVRRSVRPF